jgi:hypothetical protein
VCRNRFGIENLVIPTAAAPVARIFLTSSLFAFHFRPLPFRDLCVLINHTHKRVISSNQNNRVIHLFTVAYRCYPELFPRNKLANVQFQRIIKAY